VPTGHLTCITCPRDAGGLEEEEEEEEEGGGGGTVVVLGDVVDGGGVTGSGGNCTRKFEPARTPSGTTTIIWRLFGGLINNRDPGPLPGGTYLS
jgi:hypothetical protein